jgi:YD repeat-containing protein
MDSNMKFNNFLFCLCFLTITTTVLTIKGVMAQTGDPAIDINVPKTTPPSPNAASLGVYGQIPVSLFSGLPQVSIPLGEASLDDAGIELSINYHGGGIRPEQHPSWVGLGWDLNVGGVITRKVNGGVDEILTPAFSPETNFGYYYNYAEGNRTDWASAANMDRYSSPTQITPSYPAPDEFVFNFGKYSGSFFYDHTGKWQVRSESPLYLKVEEQLGDNIVLKGQTNGADLIIRRLFYKFTLTTPDGIRYVFGGDPAAIEFTRGADSNTDDAYHNNLTATSWYLTKIITKYDREITFKYERDGIIAIQSLNSLIFQYTEGSMSTVKKSAPASGTINIINPAYLTEIITPNQRIHLARSVSNELQYPYSINLLGQAQYNDLSRKGTYTEIKASISWKKLDSISFYAGADKFLKKVEFRYDESPDKRLMLNSLQETGAGSVNKSPYYFLYNSPALPPYNSNMLDHWGFYNGRNFFAEYPVTYSYSKADFPAYVASRAPNLSLMQAGMLTEIRYPTGGYTSIEYEPHEYALIAKRFPFTVENAAANTMCSGVRVKKITEVDNVSSTKNLKEYLYVKNYNNGGTVSSGVLGGEAEYLDEGQWTFPSGTLSYWYWYDFSIEPLSFTGGNHVTYSEVVEKLADGSYTVYNYSNHDIEKYRDQMPLAVLYTANHHWKLDPNTSMALDRGKLLQKRDFKAGNVLLRDTKYAYDESTARNSEALRIMSITNRRFGNALDRRATAYLIYSFPRLLTKATETLWDQDGANPLITEKNTSFNSRRLAQAEAFVNSTGQTITTYYRYPFDVYTGTVTATPESSTQLPFMISRNIINEPCEVIQTKTIGGTENVIGGKVLTFAKLNNTVKQNNVYALQISAPISKSSYAAYTVTGYSNGNEISQIDPRMVKRINYTLHDALGNVREYSKDDESKALIWGYDDHYLVAEVPDAGAGAIAYTSFETATDDRWILPVTARNITDALTGKRSFDMTSAGTTGIIINGITGTSILSYWTKNTVPLTITGTQGTPARGKTVRQWTYYEHKIAGITQAKITGTGLVDELRLYPDNTHMTTYTYEPLIGLTGQCSPQNALAYYEYDGLGRLKLVRDQDGNIVKQHEYEYHNNITPMLQPTGNTRCQVMGGYVTGKQEAEYKDINPGSPGYNTMTWKENGLSAACVVVPDWKATGPTRCELDAWNSYTGNGQAEQKDANPYSPTYNTLRWANTGASTTCARPACVGSGKRLVKNVCETGVRQELLSSVELTPTKWECTYWMTYSFGPGEEVVLFSSRPCIEN